MSEVIKSTKKPANPRDGIGVALMFFIMSIFLYFQPAYFGAGSVPVSLVCIFIGFAGLGLELNKITSGQRSLAEGFKPGAGIFDNAGIGIALLVLWGGLHYYFPFLWVNVLISPILLFGIYGTTLGILNAFFDFTLSKKDLDEQKIAIEAKVEDREALLRYNTSKYYLFIKTVITFVVGTVGFAAALLQALQILDVIE